MHAEQIYFFRHALIRDAAYQLQPTEDRAQLHGIVLDVFEEFADGELAQTYAAEIAEHAEFAQQLGNTDPTLPARESQWRNVAAKRARRQYLHTEAERHLRRRLALSSSALDRFHALLELTLVLDEAARYREALEACDSLIATADEIGDLKLRADAAKRHAWVLSRVGRRAEGLVVIEAFIEPIRQTGDSARLAGLLSDSGGLHRALGDVGKAEDEFRQALELSDALASERGRAIVLLNIGGLLISRQSQSDAAPLLREALALFRKLGEQPNVANTLGTLGAALVASEPDEAWHCYEEALEIALRVGNRDLQSTQLAGLASIHAKRDEYADAVRLRLEALNISRELGDLEGVGLQLGNLGDTYHKLGRLEEASRCIVEAVELARTTRSAQQEGYWLANLGAVRLDQGQAREAVALLDAALPVADRIGDPRLRAHALAAKGVGARVLGEFEKAQQLWTEGLEAMQQHCAPDDVQTMLERWNAAGG